MPGWGQHGASSLPSFLKHPGEGISRIYLASHPATQGRKPSNFHVLLYEEYERIWDTCTVANLLPQESWLGERPSLEHREKQSSINSSDHWVFNMMSNIKRYLKWEDLWTWPSLWSFSLGSWGLLLLSYIVKFPSNICAPSGYPVGMTSIFPWS